MAIAFFDLRLLGIKRYAKQLAAEIHRQDPFQRFVYFYDQRDDLDPAEVVRELPPGSQIRRVDPVGHQKIRQLLKESRCDVLVVMAQRIPDSAMVSVAKSLGMRTIMFQHGMYIPFMKREATLFVAQPVKTLRYMQYAAVVAKASGKSVPRYIVNYIRIFVRGTNIRDTSIDMEAVNTDKVLVYGEYWKEYHRDILGYPLEAQETVGYPDLDDMGGLDRVPITNLPSDIAYVAQSLVEDGRLKRKFMVEFISMLCSFAREHKKKVLVKLHPRTDKTMYIGNEDIVKFFYDKLPAATVVVGHYSSLLAKYTYVTDKIVLWNFPGHEIPFYYTGLASAVVTMPHDFRKALQHALVAGAATDARMRNIEYQAKYFHKNGHGAIHASAKLILAASKASPHAPANRPGRE